MNKLKGSIKFFKMEDNSVYFIKFIISVDKIHYSFLAGKENWFLETTIFSEDYMKNVYMKKSMNSLYKNGEEISE